MYSKQIVAYIDILGFKEIIETKGFDIVNGIYDDFNKLASHADIFVRQGMYFARHSAGIKVEDRFNFEVNRKSTMFFSDCVVWTYPIGDIPPLHHELMLMYLIGQINVWQGVLLKKGILIRGGISMGDMYIDGTKLFGQALVDAYLLERRARFPRIVIDRKVIEWDDPTHIIENHLLDYAITLDSSGEFYEIDHFKMIQQVAKKESEKPSGSKTIDVVALWTDPVIAIIPNGINHTELGVREKYEWIRNRLLGMTNVDYDLSILNTEPYKRKEQ